MKCPSCGREWPDDLKECSHCVALLTAKIFDQQNQQVDQQFNVAGNYFSTNISAPPTTPVGEYLSRLPPSPTIPSNLPQLPGEFVGREKDKTRVHEALASRWPLVCIEGIGGIGKTSLALAAAAECLAARKGERDAQGLPFFDGFIWATFEDQELTLEYLLNVVARTLDYPGVIGLQLEDKRNVVNQLLQSRRYLLVVDNLETITDHAVYRFLLNLPAPSKALMTGRERKIEQAWFVSLKGLNEDETLALIQNEEKRLGLKVLVRAEDKVLLHQATGGAPLAIKWVVGQIGPSGQSLDAILELLHKAHGDIFDKIFARSWRLLSEDAKCVLMAMTLFAGSASRAGIEAASNIHHYQLDSALGQLIRMSLVDAVEMLTRFDPRYSIHPLTRAYASKHLENGNGMREIILQRVLDHFKQVFTPASEAQTGILYWDGVGNYSRAEHLQYESANVNRLIRMALDQGYFEKALELFLLVVHFLYLWGMWEERLKLSYELVEVAQRLGNPAEAWLWVDSIGYILRQQEQLDTCLDTLEKGRKIAIKYELEDALILADAYQASVSAKQGKLDCAQRRIAQLLLRLDIESIQESTEPMRRLVARRVVSVAASLSRQCQNWLEAKRWSEIELELRRSICENPTPALSGLAYANLELGETTEAKKCLTEISLSFGQRKDQAWLNYDWALVAEKECDLPTAIARCQKACDEFILLDHKDGIQMCQALLGRLMQMETIR